MQTRNTSSNTENKFSFVKDEEPTSKLDYELPTEEGEVENEPPRENLKPPESNKVVKLSRVNTA